MLTNFVIDEQTDQYCQVALKYQYEDLWGQNAKSQCYMRPKLSTKNIYSVKFRQRIQ